MKILENALAYVREGFSVIPVNPADKRPMVKWTEFQKRMPSENETAEMFRRHPKAMLGIITGSLSKCAVIDCDSPEACQKIDEILPDSIEIPIAQSPRGGRHYYFQCPEDLKTCAGVLPKIDVRANGGVIICPPSTNSGGKQYRWLDGLELSRESLQEMPKSLVETLSQSPATCDPKGAPLNKNVFNIEVTGHLLDTAPLFSVGRRDNDLFTLANSLAKSGMREADIFRHLDFIVRSWGEHDETWVNTKIQSALKRQETKERNLWEEIRGWVLSSKGQFLSSDVQNCLVVSSRQDKKNLSECLSSLVKEGVIERVGNKNGCFRRIEKDFGVLNLAETEITPLPIKWPFGIEEKVQILPKSLAIDDGEVNGGKTAFALNFAYLNKDKFKVRYLTSEMGAQEIKSRILKMGEPIENWAGIEFIERSSHFQDLILPDGITIVDYLEKTENFYEIGGDIKNIFDRLKTGFALILIQKKAGQDWGRGGDFSAEKARLYLSTFPGILKITKAKNWTNPEVNPNGLECDFKLVNGIKFIQTSGWKKP
ncbi:MAG: bifunctional DNA primase/polymerase [Planctomycetes bacterium]|nr:bifunctional DNA primase/polymerase [Planctomycetota bacterium]